MYPFDRLDPTLVLCIFIVIVLIILVIREILCWYWKVNEIVSLLSDIEYDLRLIATNTNRNEPMNTCQYEKKPSNDKYDEISNNGELINKGDNPGVWEFLNRKLF
jgi:hypothetical protein